jgi:glycosyltransferase involved in cell wall biosynthesis
MRVVLANKFLHPKGGAERAVLDVGAELERRGHAVWYFGMDDADNVPRGDRVAVVRRRDYRTGGLQSWRDAAAMLWSLEAQRKFAALLRRARPHVVHCHNIYHQLTPSILDAARRAGVPVVLTAHDYKLVCPRYDMLRGGRPCDSCVDEGPMACWRHRCVGGSWARSLWLAAESTLHRLHGSYEGVRCIVAPSRFLLRVLLRAGLPAARLRQVVNFAPQRPPAAPPPAADSGRFVYAGRLSAEKGIETLVAAATALPCGTLVVCGDGPARTQVEAAAARAPAGRIELKGHLDAAGVAAAMRDAAFAVVPSEWFENAPFAVLEAMAQGRGVIASRIGGLPELITDGDNGRLVAPGDVGAWTAALTAAITAPARTAAWGAAAHARAGRDYAFATHVDRLEAIYAEAAA